MVLTPCAPCNCIQGYISNDKFKQDVEILLCQLIDSIAGSSSSLLDAQSFMTPISGIDAGPFNGLSKVAMQVYSVGGQANDWSVELYGSYDNIVYGRILTHSLGTNIDGGYVTGDILGVNYIKPVVKVLDLGTASSITVRTFGNSSP